MVDEMVWENRKGEEMSETDIQKLGDWSRAYRQAEANDARAKADDDKARAEAELDAFNRHREECTARRCYRCGR